MKRLCVSVCVALLTLSSLPARAQDAADLSQLRALDDCLLYTGIFIGMMEDGNNPSDADRELYNQLGGVAEDILDSSNALADKLGKGVQDAIVAEEHAKLERRMDPYRGQPNAAAGLRAEFTPDIRACVVLGRTLR
jgi:hypothetical protein